MEQTMKALLIVGVILTISYTIKPITTRRATGALIYYVIQILGIIVDTVILIAEHVNGLARMIIRKVKKLPVQKIKEEMSGKRESFKLSWKENFSIHDIVIKK